MGRRPTQLVPESLVTKEVIQYPIESSPLYKLSNKKKLCLLLECTLDDLSYIRRHGKALYQYFSTADRYKSDLPPLIHKARKVQAPHRILSDIQKRLLKFLS